MLRTKLLLSSCVLLPRWLATSLSGWLSDFRFFYFATWACYLDFWFVSPPTGRPASRGLHSSTFLLNLSRF